MKFLYPFLLVVFINSFLTAQIDGIEMAPIGGYSFLRKESRITTMRTVRPDSINLPFIEDFSYKGPFPDDNLWLDRQVLVNSTMAVNPPSVGVATFDAINFDGSPYNTVRNSTGWADTLTSNFINLATYTETGSDPRNLVPADSIYMSFYLQPKGLGFEPLTNDSLVLEFKDATGKWNSIRTFKGITKNIGADSLLPFTRPFIKIDETRYLHSKFQFRFRFFTRTDEVNAMWHLDYIKIAPNRRVSQTNLDDLTFVDLPKPILQRYTAMPFKQLKSNIAGEVQDTFNTRFYNHFTSQRNPTNTNAKITLSNGATAVSSITLLDGVNIPPSVFYTSVSKLYPSTLKSELSNFNGDSLEVKVDYSLEVEAQEGRDAYKAAFRNDKISSTTKLTDYYAYDDGVADRIIRATSKLDQIALKFRANVDDVMRGFSVYFPYVNGNSTRLFLNIRVYEDSAGLPKRNPLFQQNNVKVYSPDLRFDTLQGFTTYRFNGKSGLDTALSIKKGDFYISWQNVQDSAVSIGLDRNNIGATKYMYYFTNNQWISLATERYGAVMLRPIFSKTAPQNTNAIIDVNLSEKMTIYPNPAHDRLFIDVKEGLIENYTFHIFNLNGQQIAAQLRGDDLAIENLKSGLYILKIQDLKNNKTYFHKFVKQ